MIENIYDASFKQYKIKIASATIIVTEDKNVYLSADKIYEGSMMLGMINKTEYEIMINFNRVADAKAVIANFHDISLKKYN